MCLDVAYAADRVATGCVGIADWPDSPTAEHAVLSARPAAPYEPGAFYRRELPFLIEAVARLPSPPDLVVVDGYAWLAPDRPGLGAHLHEALGVPVVGIAKTVFRGSGALEVLRGGSRRPLLVTAAGLPAPEAAAGVRAMHGAHRIPTAVARADRLARDSL